MIYMIYRMNVIIKTELINYYKYKYKDYSEIKIIVK